jgi:hypothetical protein
VRPRLCRPTAGPHTSRNGRPTRGEWYVDDDGHFASIWPPSYDLRWMVEDGAIVGLRFTELGRGSRFAGRYRA